MVIYLDIILLLNLLIDTLLLWFTAYFRKEKIIWWRLLLASSFGCMYVVFFFFPAFSGLYQWSVKLAFSALMLLIAFGFRRLLHFMQNLCMFYFVAFVFGGGVFGLDFLLKSQSEIVHGIVVTHNDSFGAGSKPTLIVLVSGFVIVYLLSRKSYHAIQEPRKLEAFLADVVIKLAGETVLCRGLVDTGNQLREPITRIPVMVVEKSLFGHVLPSALADQPDSGHQVLDRADSLFETLPSEWQARLRLIPYRSVSRGMDFLIAVRPEWVNVTQNGQRFHCRRVLIGLNPIPLSADRSYQAIVHPALLQDSAEGNATSFEQEG